MSLMKVTESMRYKGESTSASVPMGCVALADGCPNHSALEEEGQHRRHEQRAHANSGERESKKFDKSRCQDKAATTASLPTSRYRATWPVAASFLCNYCVRPIVGRSPWLHRAGLSIRRGGPPERRRGLGYGVGERAAIYPLGKAVRFCVRPIRMSGACVSVVAPSA